MFFRFLFFLLIINLFFLITTVISQFFYHTAELAILIGVPINEAKTELEAHLVKIETSGYFMQLKTMQTFFRYESLKFFSLFLLRNNLMFHLRFLI